MDKYNLRPNPRLSQRLIDYNTEQIHLRHPLQNPTANNSQSLTDICTNKTHEMSDTKSSTSETSEILTTEDINEIIGTHERSEFDMNSITQRNVNKANHLDVLVPDPEQPDADGDEQNAATSAPQAESDTSYPTASMSTLTKPTNENNASSVSINDGSTNVESILTQQFASLLSGFNCLRNEIKLSNERLDTKIESSNAQISKQIESSNVKINEALYTMNTRLESLTIEQHNIRTELDQMKDFQHKQAQLTKSLEIKFSHELIEKINITEDKLEEKIVENNEGITKRISKFEYETKDKMQRIANQCENDIIKINNNLDQYTVRIEQIEKRNINLGATPSNIQVYCTGNAGLTPDMTLPKFHGRPNGNSPPEFLQKLKKYYEKSLIKRDPRLAEEEHLRDTIEISLEGHAFRWYQLIKGEIRTWNEFETAFNLRYWSKDYQKGIKAKIEQERYRQNGNLTRAEFLVERVIILKSLQPPLTEEEIVDTLSGHFGDLVQDAIRVQRIDNIQSFEALLHRLDLQDHNKHPRNAPTQKDRNAPSNRQDEPYSPPNNHQAYYSRAKENYHNRYRNDRPNGSNYNQYGSNTYRNSNGNYPQYLNTNQPQNSFNRNTPNRPPDPNEQRRQQQQVCTMISQDNTNINSPPQNAITSGIPTNYGAPGS